MYKRGKKAESRAAAAFALELRSRRRLLRLERCEELRGAVCDLLVRRKGLGHPFHRRRQLQVRGDRAAALVLVDLGAMSTAATIDVNEGARYGSINSNGSDEGRGMEED